MQEENSVQNLYNLIVKIGNHEFSLLEKIKNYLFVLLIDPFQSKKYDSMIRFMKSQGISIIDICNFLIEIQSIDIIVPVTEHGNSYRMFSSFTEFDLTFERYICGYRKLSILEKIDYLTSSEISNKSFNIMILLYRDFFIENNNQPWAMINYTSQFNLNIHDMDLSIINKNYTNEFHNIYLDRDDRLITTECLRCECSSQFDEHDDRRCFCDSCHNVDCFHQNIIKNDVKEHLLSSNKELCLLNLFISKLRNYETALVDNIEIEILFHSYEIDIDNVMKMKRKNYDLVDFTNFMIEYRNFSNYRNIFFVEDLDKLKEEVCQPQTLYDIKEIDFIPCCYHVNFSTHRENSYFENCFNNYLSIRSINLFVFLLLDPDINNYNEDKRCFYYLLPYIIKYNNLKLNDIDLLHEDIIELMFLEELFPDNKETSIYYKINVLTKHLYNTDHHSYALNYGYFHDG